MAKIKLTEVSQKEILKKASRLLEAFAEMGVNIPDKHEVFVDTDEIRSFTEPMQPVEGLEPAFKIFFKGLGASEGLDISADDFERFKLAWLDK